MRYHMSALLAIIPLTAIVWLVAGADAARVVSNGGTAAVILGSLVWIVAIDSKKRWPGKSWLVRLGNVMFFER